MPRSSMRSSASALLRVSPAIDALLMAAVFAAFWNAGAADARARLFLDLLIIPTWLWVLTYVGVYESQRVETLTALFRKILTGNAFVFAVAAVSSLALSGPSGAAAVTAAACIASALIVGEKLAVYAALHLIRQRGHDLRWVCIVGTWAWAQEIATRFEQHPSWGLRVGCVGVGGPDERQYLRYPNKERRAADFAEVLSAEVIDEVLVVVEPKDLRSEWVTLNTCEQYGVVGRVLLDTRHTAESPRLESFGGEVTLAVGAGPDEWRLGVKRLFDVAASAILVVAAAPVMIATAALVKLSSPGPVLFTQERIGLHGRRFRVCKFRTMVEGAEALLPSMSGRSITKGPAFKDPDDFRITPIGRLLRKFSIDELPQLFNVIRGEMSLVGPRPLPVHESAAVLGANRRRFSMPPGITCLWQINGRSEVDYATWMRYDLQYVDRWSLWLDLTLLLKTIPAVLSGRGAY
jgi:exopolysaccharide biosynthesis polyprenyl glycosylphosphotransferase